MVELRFWMPLLLICGLCHGGSSGSAIILNAILLSYSPYLGYRYILS